MINAARSMCGMYRPDPCPFADRADPAMCGAAVEALAVVAQQDRSFSPFADGEVDGSCGARHERDESGLVALADDAQDRWPRSMAMSSMLAAQASLTRKPFNPSNMASAAWPWSNHSAVKRSRPSSPRSSRRRSVGCTVGRRTYWAGLEEIRPSMWAKVEPTSSGQAPVDSRRGQAVFFHQGSVQLEVGAGGFQNGQAVIGRPLEQVAQVVEVGVEGPAAVAGQERHRCQFGLIWHERLDRRIQLSREVRACHDGPPFGWQDQRTPRNPVPLGRIKDHQVTGWL
jgi:hypothetical protein